MGRFRWWVILAVIAVVVVAAVSAGVIHQRAKPVEVQVATARTGTLELKIAASGLVESRSTDLSFSGSGRLNSLQVAEGDQVSATQTLAWLDPLEMSERVLGVADVIHAPYDGTVVEVYVRQGTVVSPGQAILRVVSTDRPWVTGFIESEDAIHLKPGQELRCRAGGYLGQSWKLSVRAVGREAVPRSGLGGGSRQVRVRCDVVSGDFALPAGTEIDIDGEVPLVGNALLIPTRAVTHESTGDSVWLIADGKAERRDVTVGPNNFDEIQILDGLSTGDEVVVHGKTDLTDGRRVKAEPNSSDGG